MYRKVLAVVLFTLVLAANGWTQTRSRELKKYNTYQTSLTNEDIMRLFVNEVRTYLQQYDRYGCYYGAGFEVYQDKQNYAWATSTVENVYQLGNIYIITLGISNAHLRVGFCNGPFTYDGQKSAREIITTRPDTVGGNQIRQHIVDMATSMFNESEMTLKMNNSNYSDESKTAFLTEIMRILF